MECLIFCCCACSWFCVNGHDCPYFIILFASTYITLKNTQVGSDVPGSTVKLTVDQKSGGTKEIALKRMNTVIIAGKLKLFDLFTRTKERAMDSTDVHEVFSDSDWAGCLRSRESTSGGVATLAGGILKSWSSTQATVAMSVGEAEYYSLVKAAAEGLGIQSVMNDLGWGVKVRIWVDSATAKSVASRIGMGKIRHMEVKFLWVQEAVKLRRVEVRKIPGVKNPADIQTKPKSSNEQFEKLAAINGKLVKRPRRCWADVAEEEVDELWAAVPQPRGGVENMNHKQ